MKDNLWWIALLIGIVSTMSLLFSYIGAEQSRQHKLVDGVMAEVKAIVLKNGDRECIVEVDGTDYRAYAYNIGVCINEVGDKIVLEYSPRVGTVYIKDDRK